ncbi:MAG: hypothetical protein H0U73_12765 [Tatlockia sp.]|nr:hypothetical protein [Tatlockia sp.]
MKTKIDTTSVERIIPYLTEQCQYSLSATCQDFFNLNNKIWLTRHVLKQILQVAQGEQSKVQAILRLRSDYLLHSGNVTDPSGRCFSNITSFMYAIWALDVRYMGKMIINCLPRNEKGEEIKAKLLEQYEEVEKNGLSYTLKGKIYIEKHYDFSIIPSLERYVKSGGDNDKLWYEVGKDQYNVPAHVAQHYCESNTSFKYSDFKEEVFTRKLGGIGTIGVNTDCDTLDWYDKRLGVEYAITRGLSNKGPGAYEDGPSISGIYGRSGNGKASLWTGSSYDTGPAIDLDAMIRLQKARIADLAELKLVLQSPLPPLGVDYPRAKESSSCITM